MSYYEGAAGNMLVIGDHNWEEFVQDPVIDGQQRKRGLIPRNYQTHPIGFYGAKETLSLDIPLIPESEWVSRIAEMEASQSSLSHVRDAGMFGQRIPSRDQNGKGYCWAHSGVSAHLLVRAANNQPYVDLSAYAIACIIKGYRDEGGWGAQGLDWQVENGCPSSEFWPQQSMKSSNDTPAMRANAKLHRIIEGWIDLNSAQYDRNLTWAQIVTLHLSRVPTINDYNFWSHSVCGVKPVNGASLRKMTRENSGKLMSLKRFDLAWGMNNPVTRGLGEQIWNSWSDTWSNAGMGVLTGSKAIPDGSTAPRVSLPSVV